MQWFFAFFTVCVGSLKRKRSQPWNRDWFLLVKNRCQPAVGLTITRLQKAHRIVLYANFQNFLQTFVQFDWTGLIFNWRHPFFSLPCVIDEISCIHRWVYCMWFGPQRKLIRWHSSRATIEMRVHCVMLSAEFIVKCRCVLLHYSIGKRHRRLRLNNCACSSSIKIECSCPISMMMMAWYTTT